MGRRRRRDDVRPAARRHPDGGGVMTRLIDLTGQRFGRLTVAEIARRNPVHWRCRCDCGNETVVSAGELRSGGTRSCGCLRHMPWNRTHGCEPPGLYMSWRKMIGRCQDKNNNRYAIYGGRGVTVHWEWQSFMPFREWALANGWRDGLVIDRIDVNGHYEPNNTRFVDYKTSANNMTSNRRITWQGRTLTVAQWAEETGIKWGTLLNRLNQGWPPERILCQPVRGGGRRV
jgi:hypothetical protein